MTRQWKCSECGEVFDSDTTDEEAQKEYEANFPKDVYGDTPGDIRIVCDECYQRHLLCEQIARRLYQ